MRITEVSKIRDVIERLKTDDASGRAQNRAKINELFNGGQPFTDQEAEENHIYTNVQPLVAPRIAHEARRQLAQATMRSGRYFNVSIDLKDKEKASLVSVAVTDQINRILKNTDRFYELLRGADATVVLHGRGPSMWDDYYAWCPKLLSIEDLKLPTNTYVDLSNLYYFAVYQELTAAELWRHINGSRADPGWNVPAVKRLIASLLDEPFESTQGGRYQFPEKLQEQFKQNGLYYATDLIPTAKLWYFYQLTDDNDQLRWELSIIQDKQDPNAKTIDEFIYKQKNLFQDSIDKIIHIQYADGANVAPFKYHSVRGMGYLLYPVLVLFNRIFCRQMDSVFEAMNQLFRNVGEQDREKLAIVTLANMSCLPPGVEYVPSTERYTVNHNLVNMANSVLRQLINENSSSFIQDIDSGTKKEMTATQVMANVQQAGVLLTSMVQMQAVYRRQLYREICRRFCLKHSSDKDVRKFQKFIESSGFPEETLDPERWDVLPERSIGGGNKVLELAQVLELMKALPMFDPQARRTILRDFVLATTDDPDKTTRLVPEEPQVSSNSIVFATLAFGTLAQGAPVIIPPGLNIEQYASTLVQLLAKRVNDLTQVNQQPAVETILGLTNVITHLQTVVGELAAAPQFYGQQTDLMDAALKQISQAVAELAARIPQAQLPPETQAKIASMQAVAEAKARATEAAAAQKLAIRQAAHEQRLAADKLKLQAELEAEDYRTAAKIQGKQNET